MRAEKYNDDDNTVTRCDRRVALFILSALRRGVVSMAGPGHVPRFINVPEETSSAAATRSVLGNGHTLRRSPLSPRPGRSHSVAYAENGRSRFFLFGRTDGRNLLESQARAWSCISSAAPRRRRRRTVARCESLRNRPQIGHTHTHTHVRGRV